MYAASAPVTVSELLSNTATQGWSVGPPGDWAARCSCRASMWPPRWSGRPRASGRRRRCGGQRREATDVLMGPLPPRQPPSTRMRTGWHPRAPSCPGRRILEVAGHARDCGRVLHRRLRRLLSARRLKCARAQLVEPTTGFVVLQTAGRPLRSPTDLYALRLQTPDRSRRRLRSCARCSREPSRTCSAVRRRLWPGDWFPGQPISLWPVFTPRTSARSAPRLVTRTASGLSLSRSATPSAPDAATSTQLLPPPAQNDERCQSRSGIS